MSPLFCSPTILRQLKDRCAGRDLSATHFIKCQFHSSSSSSIDASNNIIRCDRETQQKGLTLFERDSTWYNNPHGRATRSKFLSSSTTWDIQSFPFPHSPRYPFLDHRIARLVAKFAADFYEYFLPHEFSHFSFYAFSFWDFHTAVISQKIQDTAKECRGEKREKRRGRKQTPKDRENFAAL